MSPEILGYIFQGIPFAIAIALGLLTPMLIWISAGLSERVSDSTKLAVIIGALIIGNALSVALSGRTYLTETELAANPALLMDSEVGRSAWAGRITVSIILFISSGEILRWIFRRRTMSGSTWNVWAAFMAFYISSYWIGVMFATSHDIPFAWLYAPIAFTALALLAADGLEKALPKIQWILIAVLALSLIGGVALPNMTIERDYKSLIPGIHFRLHGFSDHANSLGAIAALALIFELSPFVRLKPRLVSCFIILAALVLAQSKTGWILGIVGAGLVRFEYFRSNIFKKGSVNFSLLVISFLMVLISLAAIAIMVGANIGGFARFLDQSKLSTFTGRTVIWEISWNEFVSSPLFGYGPALWDPRYRYEKGLPVVGQAHNQFFQTIGQAGLFGLISLACYMWLLAKRSFGSWSKNSGLAAIAFIGLAIRCWSESPMRLSGLAIGMDTFIHVLAFVFAASMISNSTQLSRRQSGFSPNFSTK